MRVIGGCIVIFGRVMRGGSTRIEKYITSPRGCIVEVTQFLEGVRIKASGQKLDLGCLRLYRG